MTSLNAPMRGKTLVSHLMWFTSSFGIGELKNIYALESSIGTKDHRHPKKKKKINEMKQSS